MLIWGCCWFNESVDTVISFINNSLNALKSYDFDTIPVVFVANTNISEYDINKLKDEVKTIRILRNNYNVYPNKNYGVYSIVSFGCSINSKYVSIVDPDWNILHFDEYVSTVLLPLINNEADIVIPNIGNASGRSNILIGKTALKLFYKEYIDDIKSSFPGSIFGTTEALYDIVTSNNYHFDWGGEWDLLSNAIDNDYRIMSKDVNVINVRHRNNKSKINDSFQIWRAVFSNDNIKDRLNTDIISNCNHRLVPLINNCNSLDDIINTLENNELTKTERQLLYMVLYPIKSIIDGKEYHFNIIEDNKDPYSKEEIYSVYELGLYCINKIIKQYNIKDLIDNAKSLYDGFFGPWNTNNMIEAKNGITKQIGDLL